MNATASIATPAQLLADLEGRYASYAEFERALVARFNARRSTSRPATGGGMCCVRESSTAMSPVTSRPSCSA